jgi:hypothetical protein
MDDLFDATKPKVWQRGWRDRDVILCSFAHLMGLPQNTSQKGELTVYSYPKAQIYFRDGKVLAIVTHLK